MYKKGGVGKWQMLFISFCSQLVRGVLPRHHGQPSPGQGNEEPDAWRRILGWRLSSPRGACGPSCTAWEQCRSEVSASGPWACLPLPYWEWCVTWTPWLQEEGAPWSSCIRENSAVSRRSPCHHPARLSLSAQQPARITPLLGAGP